MRSLDEQAPGAPRGTSLLDLLPDPAPGPATRLAGHHLLDQLQAALAELPDADRVLLLALADGASQRRLAATGGVHHATIERRARRARRRLLELLPPDAADEIKGLLS
ncbi:MAG: hypothetical protein HYU66_05455 [Armatimonadetes bacterium]|nr:hypothetical protein [Armatimonadota bacterium]